MRNFRLAIALVSSLVLVIAAPAAAMQHGGGNVMTQATVGGGFSVQLSPGAGGFTVGVNTLTLKVADRDGATVAGAAISIKPWMPDMGHGVSTKPVVKDLGGGVYEGEDVIFNMPGRWQLMVTVAGGGASGEAVFDLGTVGGEASMEGMAQGHDMGTHSGHMTASVLGLRHTQGRGDWMLGYSFMRMGMDGLLDGTDSISPAEVTGTMMNPGPYLMSPTKMTMDMHMVMAMYGATDTITLMAMFNFLDKEMDMVNRMGATPKMETAGFGDIVVSGLYALGPKLTAGLGLSLPTGSIDEKVAMMGNTVTAPYPMQLGSGTWDLIPSITYADRRGRWGWGGEADYTARLGENDNDYSLGDRWRLKAGGLYSFGSGFQANAGLSWSDWGDVDGQDPGINPMMAPTGDPDAQGGSRLDLDLGLTGMFGGGHMISAGFSVPLHQDLDGPQMETDWLFTISWHFMKM